MESVRGDDALTDAQVSPREVLAQIARQLRLRLEQQRRGGLQGLSPASPQEREAWSALQASRERARLELMRSSLSGAAAASSSSASGASAPRPSPDASARAAAASPWQDEAHAHEAHAHEAQVRAPQALSQLASSKPSAVPIAASADEPAPWKSIGRRPSLLVQKPEPSQAPQPTAQAPTPQDQAPPTHSPSPAHASREHPQERGQERGQARPQTTPPRPSSPPERPAAAASQAPGAQAPGGQAPGGQAPRRAAAPPDAASRPAEPARHAARPAEPRPEPRPEPSRAQAPEAPRAPMRAATPRRNEPGSHDPHDHGWPEEDAGAQPALFAPEALEVIRGYNDSPELKGRLDQMTKREKMGFLRECLGDCKRCGLSQTRTTIVFADGTPNAELVFVGEAPGFHEDRQGVPFVGESGSLLDRMIEAMGLERERIYICNVLKCRPPNNRDPSPEEVQRCSPFLYKQLETVDPRAIVTLGRFASQCLLQTDTPMRRLRGRWHDWRGIPVMPTFHPAYLLRTPADKRLAWEDLQKVMKMMGLTGKSS